MSSLSSQWCKVPAALVLYLGCAWLSIGFIAGSDEVALIWLPAGVALALAIRWGLRVLLLVAFAVPLMHQLFAPVPPLFLAYSVAANVAGLAAGIGVFHALGGCRDSRLSVRTGFQILLAGAALALVSRSIGSLGLHQSGLGGGHAWPYTVLVWTLGDLFGVIALTATLLLVVTALARRQDPSARPWLPQPRRHPVEYSVWVVLICGVMLLLLWAGAASGAQALGLAGLPMAVLLWSAVRFPPLFTFVATTVLALVVTAVTGLGIAGFSNPSGAVESAVLIGFLCITMVVPQVLASAIHENRVAALRLLRRALRDSLTGLPNRTAFDEALRAALAEPPRSGRRVLVAYLDLDQFKIINDTLSHSAGDALLRELPAVIRDCLDARASLFRIGGDEFAVIETDADPMQVPERLEQICSKVAGFRFVWQSGVVATRVSIGYALTATGADPDHLLAEVDTACFTAKELGGNRVQRAGASEQAVRERTSAMRWVMRISEAIEKDRLELHCQAITPLSGLGDGLHFEVLLRKRDPVSGELLPPAEFVAAAERFGLAARLDTHVVDQCLRWLEQHPQEAARVSLCSINLSTASLVDPGFTRFLRERLVESSFPPDRLCFEITETGAVRDLSRAIEFIHGLRALGCRFALDDFGTGFCSFAYLPKLEVDLLKIDGSFVREVERSPLALEIVKAIVRIARVTGRETVAEWVETPELAARMRELGLDYAQGYAYSRPQPIDEYFASAMAVPAARATPLELPR
jgi:diguanylate cyclase (GGDEF)-like protein